MSVIIFVLLRLVPGNIVDIMFDSAGFVDPSEKATIEKELDLISLSTNNILIG